MKMFHTFFFFLFIASLVLLSQSCDNTSDSTNPPVVDPGTGVNGVFNTSGGGSLKTSNDAEIIVPMGAISYQANGSLGEVSFSITPDVKTTDLTVQIPSNLKVIGSIYQFGPINFIFADPVKIFLPAGTESSPEGLSIVWFNDEKNEWSLLPLSEIDAVKKRIGVSVFELGYFAVVRPEVSSTNKAKDEIKANTKVGGIRMKHHEDYMKDYNVTLTIVALQYTYPDIPWTNLLGVNATNGSTPTSDPLPITYLGNIPQGNYTIQVTRRLRGTISRPPGKLEVYSANIPITVTGYCSPVEGWSWEGWGCWNDLILAGGQWLIDGEPPAWWSKPTIPKGNPAKLIAHYPFTGNANDVTGNGHNGVATGVTLTTDRFGNSGAAYEFSESDKSHIKAHLGNYSSISVSLWYNSPGIFNYHYPILLNYSNRDAEMNHLTSFSLHLLGNNSVYAGKEGSVYFSLFYSTGIVQQGPIESPFIPSFNTWHHVVAIYDRPSKTTKLYIDNVLIDENNCDFNLEADYIYIGSGLNPGTPNNTSYKGKIDDIKIYNGTLEPAQVKALFEEK